jgi:hypothetical protein
MIDWIFQALAFLPSNTGLLLTGAITALLILLWDWRFALISIGFIQLSVATSAVLLHAVPAEWGLIQTVIVALVCLMLMLSAREHELHPSIRQTGTGVSRGFLLGMFLAGAWFMDLQMALPGIDPLVMELFVWLVLCGIMLLGLSDHPLYNGIGLLLWLIPVQAVISVVTPIPVIVAFVGLLILLVGMAVSYLVFVEHMPAEARGPVLTDLAFPQQLKVERSPDVENATAGSTAPAHARWPEWMGRALPQKRRSQSRRADTPAPSAPAKAPTSTAHTTTQPDDSPRRRARSSQPPVSEQDRPPSAAPPISPESSSKPPRTGRKP